MTAPRNGDTEPGSSPNLVNEQQQGEGETHRQTSSCTVQKNPQATSHLPAKSLRLRMLLGEDRRKELTQVDIKSKEYKVATVLTYILSATCAETNTQICLYMLVAKAEAGRTMPRAQTMYLRVTSIK